MIKEKKIENEEELEFDEKRKDQRRKTKRRKDDIKEMDKIREWLSTLLPVILFMVAGVILIIEWRSTQTQQIQQLKEADERIKAQLTRQIELNYKAIAKQIESTDHHIVLNRKYMEKNRDEINDCSEQIAKFQGIFFDSRSIFEGFRPPHGNNIRNSLIKNN